MAVAEPSSPSTDSARRAYSLRAYLLALVAVAVVVIAAGVWLTYESTADDARRAARDDARFAARLAATSIAEELETIQTTLAQSAASPALPSLVENPGPDCRLPFGGGSLFTAGHVEVVRPDGLVLCSSRRLPARPYAGDRWLRRATAAPVFEPVAIDPTTKERAVLGAAPMRNGDLLVGFLALAGLGPGLDERLSGPRDLEFVVTTRDARTVLARSIDTNDWAGTPVADTAFDVRDGSPARDVEGNRRLYGDATVGDVGWRVYAGADEEAALASASRTFRRDLVLLASGLAVMALVAFVIYRRVARPIQRLGRSVRDASESDIPDRVTADGPREVVDLADDFNSLLGVIDRQLSERRRAEEVARQAEQNLRLLFDANPQPMYVVDRETLRFLEVNDAAAKYYGYTREQFANMTSRDIRPAEDAERAEEFARTVRTVDRTGPWRHRKADGTVTNVMVWSHVLRYGARDAILGVVEDVTERERLERELRQSQRLESIGQLAGGVAHDFNNLLAVMANYATLAAEDVATVARDDERLRQAEDDIGQVIKAAGRATDLTRQLLTFARRDVVRAELIDLNEVIDDVEPLLRRTLGEDVDLRIALDRSVRPVRVDRGQVEQVLLNLAVNARDAMPTGGTLVIDTAGVVVDEDYATRHPGVELGPYVRLRVSDTGTGMDAATVDRALEPFFTTKPVGQGTGLGLSTVHGIVQKAGGHLRIYSEPGIGTTITVELPAEEREVALDEAAPAPASVTDVRGGTVLVVEDDDALRDVTRRVLERNGYDVLSASNGPDAIVIAREHPGDIDLLLTDVILPDLTGKDTADRVLAIRPGLPVVYMSGYAEPLLASRGTLDAGIVLVHKPFSEHDLMAHIAQAMHVRR